jgi:hypothetical protein
MNPAQANTQARRHIAAALVPVLVLAAGLSAAETPATHDDLPCDVRTVIERAGREFSRVRFLKPAQSEGAIEQKLAPLIVEELAMHEPQPPSMIGLEDHLDGRRNASRRPIYFDTREVSLGGRRLPLVTYLWFYEAPSADPMDPGPTPLLARGIRILLGEDDQPMLWQALTEPSEIQVFYVAQSLESNAAKARGTPSPHRRYAIEKAKEETPATVVVNLVDDGPVPMGPYVYIEANEERPVATVHCRCSPSRFSEVVENVGYELVPVESMNAERAGNVAPVDLRKVLAPPPFEALFHWPKDAP